MSFIFWHRLSKFCLPPRLWPILLCKSIAMVIHPSIYAQNFFSTNWSTPYQLSMFQLIRFTLIEVLTHVIIKPSRILFRCIGNVQHSAGQTLPLTKGLGQSSCFPPIFLFPFFFDVKENFQASFGNRLVSCEPLGLFHINVEIIVMHGNLSPRLNHLISSMCLRQVFLGRLRDWVPICWLVTEKSRASPLAICLVL